MNRHRTFGTMAAGLLVALANVAPGAHAQTAPKPFNQCKVTLNAATNTTFLPLTPSAVFTVDPGFRLIARHASFSGVFNHDAKVFVQLVISGGSTNTVDAQHFLVASRFFGSQHGDGLWVGSMPITFAVDPPATLSAVLNLGSGPTPEVLVGTICVSGELVPLPPSRLVVGGQ